MSGSKPKTIPQVNLEEFEWRLRASIAGESHVEDPLAELTRLVDNFHVHDEPAAVVSEDSNFVDRLEPSFTHPPEMRLQTSPRDLEPKDPIAKDEAPDHVGLRAERDSEEPVSRVGGRKWKVAGLAAAAIVMSGIVVVLKFGDHTSAGPPPLILASTEPTGAPPPTSQSVHTGNDAGALLHHDTTQPTEPKPKLVDTPETPVDLSVPLSSTRPSADSGLSPPPLPNGEAPKHVKTIFVRPDGQIVVANGNDPEPSTPSTLDEHVSPLKPDAPVETITSGLDKEPTPTPPPVLRTASADAQSSSGAFAVQLSSTKDEKEARALVKRFHHRFANAIGSAELVIRKTERNGDVVYRIRVVGLTKGDARDMCQKIKSDHGDCYVAHN